MVWKVLRFMRKTLPVLVLIAAFLATQVVVNARQEPAKQNRTEEAPAVQTIRAEVIDQPLVVEAYGTVQPRTASDLVAQVSGVVVDVNPALKAGGSFAEGDVLLRIDARDYELAVVEAEAEVARLDAALQEEQARAEVARREWRDIGRGEPNPLAIRKPQLRTAEANLMAAKAKLRRAELNLERCAIRAPYEGRTRRAQVDVGQFVAPGTPLARLYATDAAEVRLPVCTDDLAKVEMPIRGGAGNLEKMPGVVLRTRLGGQQREWEGRIIRTEGEIDTASRMLYLVAQVDRPFDGGPDKAMAPGLFVEAKIRGRTARGVVRVPRATLQEGQRLMVLTEDDRLAYTPVDVLETIGEDVLVRGPLNDGQRICLTRLLGVPAGTRVTALPATAQPRGVIAN